LAGEEVSSEYLVGEELARYGSIESTVKTVYVEVLSSIKDPARLPYTPVLYVIPWIPMKKLGRLARLYYYNLMFADPKNFEKYAIFSVLNFLERFQKYIAGGLGHEIAHIIQTKGRAEVELLEIVGYIKNPIKTKMKREVDAKEFYELFNEPIQSTIRKWNELSKYPEIMEEVSYDAQVVDMKRFCKLIFGDKEQEFEQHIAEKLSKIHNG